MIFSISVNVAFCAIGTSTGKEPNFWNNHAIVIGKVTSLSRNSSTIEFSIDVLGVVTTDILVLNKINLTYSKSRSSALMGLGLKQGDIIILCLNYKKNKWTLPSSYMTLFDSGLSVMKLKSLQDSALKKQIEKIKKLKKEDRDKRI